MKGALDPRKVAVLTWDTPERIRPTQDNVLIRILPQVEYGPARILLPSSSQREWPTWQAEVVAVGPGAYYPSEDGGERFVATDLHPGDRVLVKRDPGWEVGSLRMLKEGGVLAVLEQEAAE